MLTVALNTLRDRWSGFAGTFLGLALGVTLMAAVGVAMTGSLNARGDAPLRYAAAPVVVTAADQLTVTSAGYSDHLPLSNSPGLSPALIAKVAATGRIVLDRTFYAQPAGVQLPGAGQPVGHAWSAAAFTPYHLTGGRAPATNDQVVLAGAQASLVGRQVTVLTAQGPARFTVSGVTAPVSFERAVFFTDAQAALLSPRVDALAAYGPVAAVRQAVATSGRGQQGGITAGPVEVLTGAARHDADAVTAVDQQELQAVNGLLGVAGGLAAFVAIFLTGSTFAFSVQQRRRELAVLRCTGATPAQIGRLVLAESAIVGVVASACGALLGFPGGWLLAHWLVARGQAPDWYQVSFSTMGVVAVVAAFLIGLVVSVGGVSVACVRAARIRPVEALRQAAVDRKPMTPMRWLGAISSLALGLSLLIAAPLVNPLVSVAFNQAFAGLAVVGFALLSPVLVGPLVRLFTLPLAGLRGATALLARENLTAAAGRTAATAIPVLITIGLAAATLGGVTSLSATKATEQRSETTADFVIVPDGTPGLSQAAVDSVQRIAGLQATAVSTEDIYGPMPDSTLVQYTAQVVTPAGLSRDFNLRVISGRLTALNSHSIVVDQEWGLKAGDPVTVYRSDGTRARLTVAAVVRTGIGENAAFLAPSPAAGTLAGRIDVRLRPGADPETVYAQLVLATRGLGGQVVPQARWAAAIDDAQSTQSWTNATTVLLIALVYTGLSIINTLVMATAARSRELAMLRLGGATRRQVLLIVAAESLLVVAVGVALGAMVAVLSLAGLGSALRDAAGQASLSFPWATLALTAISCATAAVLAAVGAARFSLRTRPVELAGVRE
jgi:putative ABC transport system permease protein